MNHNFRPATPLLRFSAVKAIFILLCLAFFFMCVLGIVSNLLTSPHSTRIMRVLSVVQDVMVFVLPAAIMAVIASPVPGRILEIDRRPPIMWVLTGIIALLTSMPALNFIVEWNGSLTLPASLDWMKEAEMVAQKSVEILMGGTSVADLIMNILIIGVLAGVSEEIFFRGAIMGCLMQTRLNKHIAIWLTGIIFSLFHMQIFGFVPRMILGAYFGYLTWWTGSIWVAASVHVFNNSLIVIAEWLTKSGIITYDINHAGSSNFMLIVGSVILTGGIIRASLKHLGKTTDADNAD
ncbi:MAG: CPBP family intramembrane metalloprotease [Duncaniella sp.]|nr:CPBP family intramembrane metalloprotease [Duncaniella sp.]